jgi:hypothetical protein
MSDTKISQLTAGAAAMKASDLIEVSKDNGSGGYDSRSRTGEEVYNGVLDQVVVGYSTSSIDQTFVANTDKAIEFENGEILQKCDLGAPGHNTGIVVDEDGFYEINFTASIFNDGNTSAGYCAFFLENNGVNETNSARIMERPEDQTFLSYSTSWIVYIYAGNQINIICNMEKGDHELRTDNALNSDVPSAVILIKRIS